MAGFVVRIIYRYNMTSIGLYTVQQLLIVVSPACYFAFNYLLFGRLVYNTAQDDRIEKTRPLTFIKAEHMGALFVTSDVVTFVMQVSFVLLLLERDKSTLLCSAVRAPLTCEGPIYSLPVEACKP
jgi:hypothetical protein